jgi:hypothetical protein
LTARVLEKDIGEAVAVEVAGSDCLPVRSRIGTDGGNPAGDLVGPVHFPDRHLTVDVLQQNVGITVAVEVTGSHYLPVWSRIGAGRCDAAGDLFGPVHFPDRHLTVEVL